MSAQKPAWRPLGLLAADAMVRLWPAESKEWGRAVRAEFSEIASAWEFSRWLFGGLMLLAPERIKRFRLNLARPLGYSPNDAGDPLGKPPLRVPHPPLWLTALLLFSAGAVLLHPEVRSSLRSTTAFYGESGWNPALWNDVKILREA